MNDAAQDRFQRMVGRRIEIARKEQKLTQAQLSDKLGFTARQTLAYIEAGQRKVTAEELVKAIHLLGKPMEFFTDPCLLIGEAKVSWRAAAEPRVLAAYEAKTLPVIGMYRLLMSDFNLIQTALIPQLPIGPSSTFEEAAQAAERLVREWKLGPIPAKELATVAEEKLNLLILMVDAPVKVSGAAVHLNEFDTIIINRKEPSGRRNYDLGHELFHILTWNSMTPPRLDTEEAGGSKQKRIEQLAEAFTSALLMPAETIRVLWEARKEQELSAWINETASVLGVSVTALSWRLVNLKYIKKEEAVNRGQRDPEAIKPKLYSFRFVRCLYKGLEKGLISVRRAASVLDCTIEDLEELFRDYGFQPPFDL